MARPITTTAVGRVNRRFLFLALILAVLSAVLVYAAVTQSGGDGGSSSVETPVVIANQEIAAGTEITGAMLEVASFADTQAPAGAIAETDLVVGLIAKENIAAREAVLTSSVVDTSTPIDGNVLAYIIESQQRGMAISVAQVSTAGGLVLPGDHVDIYWIPKDPPEDTPATLLAENVEVLAVQQSVLDIGPTAPGVTDSDTEGDPAASAASDRQRSSVEDPVPEATTVTLMLTPRQALNVFCGNQGGILMLAVRAWGDDSPSGPGITPVECLIQGKETQQQ